MPYRYSDLMTGETCEHCGIRPLMIDDHDKLCAYCATYAESDAAAMLKSRKTPIARRTNMDYVNIDTAHETIAFFRERNNARIDIMDPIFYGGDRDTMVNVIDFSAI